MCKAAFKSHQVYPFFPTWELPTLSASPASVGTAGGTANSINAATGVQLQNKLQVARAACDAVAEAARRRKRDREDVTQLVAHAPQVLKTTLLSCTGLPSLVELKLLQARGMRLREMVDLGVKVALDEAVQVRSPLDSSLCVSEQFYCDGNGEVKTLSVAVTSECAIVINWNVARSVRIPAPITSCKAAAIRFLVSESSDEFYVVAVVGEKGDGGLYRYSVQRDGEIVLLFPFASTDFLVAGEGAGDGASTKSVERFVEICNEHICLVGCAAIHSMCGMYHVLGIEFSSISGVASQLFRVAFPVLVHSCPHRMLLQEQSGEILFHEAPEGITRSRLLSTANWAVRFHRFPTPRRTVALVSWNGMLDGDVMEEIRQGHRDILLVRETLTCLSIYAMSGAVLGSVHCEAPIVDFAWCRDEHRGHQNRVGGDELAFYCHIFVLSFDGVLREYAVHV